MRTSCPFGKPAWKSFHGHNIIDPETIWKNLWLGAQQDCDILRMYQAYKYRWQTIWIDVEVVPAPVIEPGTGEKNSDNLCFDGDACLIVPRHPLGRIFEQRSRIFLKGHEIIKCINVHQVTGMDQAHEHISNVGTMFSSIKKGVFPVHDTAFQALFANIVVKGGAPGTIKNWVSSFQCLIM